MKETYTIEIPMDHLRKMGCDPFKLMRIGKPDLTYNEGIYLLTTYFIKKYNLFPENFNVTKEYSYKSDKQFLYITIPKDSVDTREIKE